MGKQRAKRLNYINNKQKWIKTPTVAWIHIQHWNSVTFLTGKKNPTLHLVFFFLSLPSWERCWSLVTILSEFSFLTEAFLDKWCVAQLSRWWVGRWVCLRESVSLVNSLCSIMLPSKRIKGNNSSKNDFVAAALWVQNKWATKALKRAFLLNSTVLDHYCLEEKKALLLLSSWLLSFTTMRKMQLSQSLCRTLPIKNYIKTELQ